MKSLAVRVLGDFGVDGIEPQALGSRKARLALNLLALADGQAVPAGVLIDALWDTVPPARPEDQLAVLMSRLRSVLGRDRIERRDQGYLLHRDWLDAAELAALTREVEARRQAGQLMGAVAAARVALSLIRGGGPQPLPGEWAQLRRAELERLIGRSRLVAATALLEAGDWMAACDAASAAIERDPYDETALRVLLRGYVTGGRVAAALAAYASARARMADELGTDPSPETAALYTAILRGELTTGPGAAQSSPGLVGRDDELACLEAIAARVRGGSAEAAVVDGEAGIGKTASIFSRRAHSSDSSPSQTLFFEQVQGHAQVPGVFQGVRTSSMSSPVLVRGPGMCAPPSGGDGSGASRWLVRLTSSASIAVRWVPMGRRVGEPGLSGLGRRPGRGGFVRVHRMSGC